MKMMQLTTGMLGVSKPIPITFHLKDHTSPLDSFLKQTQATERFVSENSISLEFCVCRQKCATSVDVKRRANIVWSRFQRRNNSSFFKEKIKVRFNDSVIQTYSMLAHSYKDNALFTYNRNTFLMDLCMRCHSAYERTKIWRRKKMYNPNQV